MSRDVWLFVLCVETLLLWISSLLLPSFSLLRDQRQARKESKKKKEKEEELGHAENQKLFLGPTHSKWHGKEKEGEWKKKKKKKIFFREKGKKWRLDKQASRWRRGREMALKKEVFNLFFFVFTVKGEEILFPARRKKLSPRIFLMRKLYNHVSKATFPHRKQRRQRGLGVSLKTTRCKPKKRPGAKKYSG